MKIKMRYQVTGTRDGVKWPPRGGIVDLPDAEAEGMVRQGYADPVEEKATAVPKGEQATATPKSTSKKKRPARKPARSGGGE